MRTQCVTCATVLSNEALKPAEIDLKTVHTLVTAHLNSSLENKKMKLGTSGTEYESCEHPLSAPFEVSQLIAKAKKPHTIGETLEKPSLIKGV